MTSATLGLHKKGHPVSQKMSKAAAPDAISLADAQAPAESKEVSPETPAESKPPAKPSAAKPSAEKPKPVEEDPDVAALEELKARRPELFAAPAKKNEIEVPEELQDAKHWKRYETLNRQHQFLICPFKKGRNEGHLVKPLSFQGKPRFIVHLESLEEFERWR